MAAGMMILSHLLVPILLSLLVIWVARRFEKLSVTAKKWWLFSHVMFVVICFSGFLGVLVLSLATRGSSDSSFVYSGLTLVHPFGYVLVLPGLFGSLVTGVVLADRSSWGLTDYYWVIAKLVGSIGVIMFGGTLLGQWIHEPFADIPAGTVDPLGSPMYGQNRQLLFMGLGIAFAVLLFLSAISYLKPWGKRRGA